MKLGRRLGALFGSGSAPGDSRADEPCIPCGQQPGVRQFSLNPAPPIVIGDDLRLQLTPGRQFAVVDGQVVLYDPIRSVSHVLNPSAAAVWASVDGERTVAELIDVLQADTGTDRDVLDRDVRATLAQFVDSHIVTEAGPEPAPTAATPPLVGGAQTQSADRWASAVSRRLDQVEWTTVIGPVQAGGVEVVVRTNQATVAQALTDALGGLAPGRDPGSAPAVVVSLYDPGRGRPVRWYADGRRQWTGPDATLVDEVLADLTQRVLAGTPGQLLLHAGAVARRGQVVLVAGASGRGKSTLTAALVARGFAYATDEVAIVDPHTLELSPYAKALDLDGPARARLGIDEAAADRAGTGPARQDHKGRRAVPVSALGAPAHGGRVALLVLLNDEIGDEADVSASPAVHNLIELVAVTFAATFADDLALEWLADIAASVPLVRIGRAPLDQMADQVEAALRA